MNASRVSTNLQQHEQIQKVLAEIGKILENGDLTQHYTNKVSKLKALFNAFEQAPRALDEHLTEYTTQISGLYFTAKNHKNTELFKTFQNQIFEQIADLIYILAKVRGYKFVANQLSNDVYLVPKLVKLIESPEISQNHSEIYFLLLWLSRLVLVPFPLASVHSEIGRSIFNIAIKHLALHSTASKIQVVSSVLLASLLARPDCGDLFFEYTGNVILDWPVMSNENAKLGHLMTLNQILKKSMGGIVSDLVEEVHESVISHEVSQMNLQTSSTKINTFNALYLIKISTKMCRFYIARKQYFRVSSLINSNNDLMHYMGDSFDSMLRECMAKNLAKTVSFLRLKALNYTSQVVAYMLDQLRIHDLMEHKYFWPDMNLDASDLSVPRYHTVLLFLGFLALTKTLPSEYVPTVFSIIHKTCYVSQRTFAFVQTAQLRDASCFCAWALLRMLSNQQFSDLRESSPQLVPAIFLDLVYVAIFDEDFTMRRCGIAVLQEFVGRFGSEFLPEMLTQNNASKVGEFTISFVEQFGTSTVGNLSDSHEIIHALIKMGFSSRLFIQPLLAEILADSSSFELQKLGSRHLARIIRSAECVSLNISSSVEADISWAILSLIESLKSGHHSSLYALAELESRELLDTTQRSEISVVVKNLTLGRSSSSSSGESIMHWLNALENKLASQSNVSSMVSLIQRLDASESLVLEFEAYFKKITVLCDESFMRICHEIRVGNKLLASSIAVANLNADQHMQIYRILKDKNVDAEARANIIAKIGDSWLRVENISLLAAIISELLDDYTKSEQGDVGSKVRLACIHLIRGNYQMFFKHKSSIGPKLLRMAGEPIDKLRISSFQAFCELHIIQFSAENMVQYKSDYCLYFSDLFKIYSEFSALPLIEDIYHDAFWSGLVHSSGASSGTSTMINSSFKKTLEHIRNEENFQSTITTLLGLLRIPPGAKVSNLDSRNQKLLVSVLGLIVKILDAGVDLPSPIHYDTLFVRAYNLHINTRSISRIALVIRSFELINTAQNVTRSSKQKCRKRLCWLACQHPIGQIRGTAADSLFEIVNETDPFHSIIPILESYKCNLRLATARAAKELESVFLAI